MVIEHKVSEKEASKQVLHVLKNTLGLSSRLITRLKKNKGSLLLNGADVFTNAVLKENDIVKVVLDFDEISEGVEPEEMPLDVLYEDELLIALNKSPGIVMHPTYNHPRGTLSNGLAYYLQSKGEKCLIRPVSRLDRDTSGVVIFAKNQFLQDYLTKSKQITKVYYGLVKGVFDPPGGKITFPIKRLESSTIERIVSPDGAPAETHYATIGIYSGTGSIDTYSLAEFVLKTGRTHQIRVHAMYSGHPLIGETLYNKDLEGTPLDLTMDGRAPRQCLHSGKISFIHPSTQKELIITSEIPDDMKNIIK